MKINSQFSNQISLDDLLLNLITNQLEFIDNKLESAMAEYQSKHIEGLLVKVPVTKQKSIK